MEQLKKLKVSQQCGGSGPNLFSSDDLDTIFKILDPTGQNYITGAQYRHGRCGPQQRFNRAAVPFTHFLHDLIFSSALSTLGIREVNECPDGINEDRISPETFKSEA